jgi:hypothetical protein
MVSKVCSRHGAGGGERLRPPFRLAFGSVAFDIMPDGWVRVVTPAQGEFCDLAAFIAAMRAKGGA